MTTELKVPRYVQDGIKKAAGSLQFSSNFTVDYDFRTGSYSSGCVSVVYQITLREEPREVTLLCKVPPTDADETVLSLFEREVFVYQSLLPTFVQFQEEHDILPGTEEFIYAPTCHYAYFDAKRSEGLLILEDVGRRMFANKRKYEPIDYDHGRLAMIQLGRFHAVSLAFKDQHPELFECFQQLEDATKNRVMSMDGFKDTMELSFEQAIRTLSVHEVTKKDKLNRLRLNFVEELSMVADSELTEPFCVVCHGDYSSSNVMYRYNGGFPNRLVMLDWQLAKYGSPALDFLHFMFLSTDESFRRNHYDNMLQTYHSALMGHLERLGGENATERFPLTSLMRLIKTQAKYAVTLAVLNIPMTIFKAAEEAGQEDAIEKENGNRISETTDVKYHARMNGFLKDVFRLGYL